MTPDFSRNPKQQTFYDTAMAQLAGAGQHRHLFYGGAIRGGKTWVCLSIFAQAAVMYPNSRWYVFRKTMPSLLQTTIPSFDKIIADDEDWIWRRDKANYYAKHKPTGSEVHFKAENIKRDPELHHLLGLECNGILYEQIDELSEQLYQIGNSRLGSWLIDQMPAPISLATFNPTQNWVKTKIYEPHVKGTLPAPIYYMTALPTDNGYVTAEQWRLWEGLDEIYRKQYIEGDWTDYRDRSGLWAFAYKPEEHTAEVAVKPFDTLYLSFDFNRNPICCNVIQYEGHEVRVLEVITLPHSDIYAMCDQILVKYPNMLYRVTGDATGRHQSALAGNAITYYTVIQQRLNITNRCMDVPNVNPDLRDNQALVNLVLAHWRVRIHPDRAAALHYDMANVKIDHEGKIRKARRSDPTQQADALDGFRYFCNVYLKEEVLRGR